MPMLTSLTLQNFALVDQLELGLSEGFNVITGETGAGKSLLLDALSLCTGGRADKDMVRHGQDSADVFAQFEDMAFLQGKNSGLATWFGEREREFDGEVLIRRQLMANGRSKAWLNGSPVSLSELKELGAMLVNIHSQHAQQALLKPQFVMNWLDDMAGLKPLAKQVSVAFETHTRLKRQAEKIAENQAQRQDRISLLESQLADIEPLLTVDYAQIEAEHEELTNLEALMLEASEAVAMLDNDSDEPDVASLIGRAIRICDNQSDVSPTFAKISDSLYLAQEQISEATGMLMDYAEQQLPDPERLEELNTLISLGHRLSRKHGLPAGDLVAEANEWQAELDELNAQPTADAMTAQIDEAWQAYLQLANDLHEARSTSAPAIADKLVAMLKPLALPNARAEFAFTPKETAQFNAHGTHEVELLFGANVGMPLQPLHKVASGGELSRMALVMQVLVATADMVSGTEKSDADVHSQPQPMLVFDEVDVGISGGTAQVVGELLRSLGKHQQLLAITHQAQVASQAHQHILVQKSHGNSVDDAQNNAQTTSTMTIITGDAQIDELARMSGGVNITDVTREHARSLLAGVGG